MSGIDLVIFAASRKSRAFCVAGKDLKSKKWIRPVSSLDGGAIFRSDLEPLQVLNIGVTSPAKLPTQPENMLIENESWKSVGDLDLSLINDYLDWPSDLWGETANTHHAYLKDSNSLYLIKVEKLEIYLKRNIHDMKRVRGRFIYNNVSYDLPLTDPRYWHYQYNNLDFIVTIQEVCYLCISLALPMKDGNCYKLIAGIIRASLNENESTMKKFINTSPRKLPVFLLLDASASMRVNNKIGQLNEAVKSMIENLRGTEDVCAEINLCIVKVSGDAPTIEMNLTPVSSSDLVFNNLEAFGKTPIGAAIDIVISMIENDNIISSQRDYRPILILLSDGSPTDEYEHAINNISESIRVSKSLRIPIGVGDNPDTNKLDMFSSLDSEVKTLTVSDVGGIAKLFQLMTMTLSKSVSSSSSYDKDPVEVVKENLETNVNVFASGDDEEMPF